MAQLVCPLCGTAQKKKSYFGEYQRCAGCLRIVKLSDMKCVGHEEPEEKEISEKELQEPASKNKFIAGTAKELGTNEGNKAGKETEESEQIKLAKTPGEHDVDKIPDSAGSSVHDVLQAAEEPPGPLGPETPSQTDKERGQHTETVSSHRHPEEQHGHRPGRRKKRRRRHHGDMRHPEDIKDEERRALKVSVLTVIFVWPWGLYRIWTHRQFPVWARIAISASWAIIMLVILLSIPGGSSEKDFSSQQTRYMTRKDLLPGLKDQGNKSTETSKRKFASKEDFSKWLLANFPITYLEFINDGEIYIRLESGEYTSREEVRRIALQIVTAYKSRTGYKNIVTVTVLKDGEPYVSAAL